MVNYPKQHEFSSSGLAPAPKETAQKLAAKHPRRSSVIEEQLADPFIESPVELSSHQFITNIKKAPKGSRCGPSGWRYEHLGVLISDSFTAENLFRVCSIITAGLVPEPITKLLCAARLIICFA